MLVSPLDFWLGFYSGFLFMFLTMLIAWGFSGSSESRKKTRKLELGEEQPHNSGGNGGLVGEKWVLEPMRKRGACRGGGGCVMPLRVRVVCRLVCLFDRENRARRGCSSRG